MEFNFNFFNNQIYPYGYYQNVPLYYPTKPVLQKSSSGPNIFHTNNNNDNYNYGNNYSPLKLNYNNGNNYLPSYLNYNFGNNYLPSYLNYNYGNKYLVPSNNFLPLIKNYNHGNDNENNHPKQNGLLEKQYFYKKIDPKIYNFSNMKNKNNFIISNNHKKKYNFTNMNNIKNNQHDKQTNINYTKNLSNKNLEILKPKKKFFSVPKKPLENKNKLYMNLKIENKIIINNLSNNKKEDISYNKNNLSSLIQEKNFILSPPKKDYINKNNMKNKNSFLSTVLDFYNPNKTNLIKLEKLKSDYKENSYEAKDIKVDIASLVKEIKINKLKINLIFFYEEFSDENIDLYNKLKLNILGGYFGVRKVYIFEKLLNEMKIDKSGSSFILICIGSSFEKIDKICNEFDCIKYIIIFCFDVNFYKQKYGSNLKVKLISKDQKEIYDYLIKISNNEPNYNKKLKNLINHNLLISFYEYENYYYIHHKMLSFFFKEDFSELDFCDDYMEKVFNFIDEDTDLKNKEKNELKQIIENLKNSLQFLNDILKFYTSESKYVYLFNRTMRNIEVGMERLSFLIGPMYYAIVRYLMKKNSNLMFNKRNKLYRNIYINQYDLENYYMAEGKIICFPSFTSTSFKKGFEPTNKALHINNLYNEKILLKMELSYEPKYDNIPQGMILKDFSVNPNEEEILLFPFTFIKVKSIKKMKNNFYKLKGNILNKDSILEFGLRKGKKVFLKNEVLTIE